MDPVSGASVCCTVCVIRVFVFVLNRLLFYCIVAVTFSMPEPIQ